MAQFRLTVSLPDSPGSLGAVASAIGFVGGNIKSLIITDHADEKASDEIVVAIPGADPTDLLDVLGSLGGVEILDVTKIDSA
jgi:ACT domain-containing protein